MRIPARIALPAAGTVGAIVFWGMQAPNPNRSPRPNPASPAPAGQSEGQDSSLPEFNQSAREAVANLERNFSESPASQSEPLPMLEKGLRSGFLSEPNDIVRAHPGYRAKLEHRAHDVEREANRELAKLVRLLDLSEAQQNRIFGILVSTSAAFDPIMQIEGGALLAAAGPDPVVTDNAEPASPSRKEQIHQVLDPDQKEVFVQDELDRMEFWDDAIADLGQLITDDDLPQMGVDPPPEPEPADDWRDFEIASDNENESGDVTEDEAGSSSKKKKKP